MLLLVYEYNASILESPELFHGAADLWRWVMLQPYVLFS